MHRKFSHKVFIYIIKTEMTTGGEINMNGGLDI